MIALTAPIAAPAAYPEGPLWTWPRGAAMPADLRPGDGACVCVTHGMPSARRAGLRLVDDDREDVACDPSSAAYLPTRSRWLALTSETIDPAWWRERLPGVAYEIELWPDGMEHPATSRRIASVGADDEPASVVVTVAERVRVQWPGGVCVRAELRPGDGPPTYSVALSPESLRIGRELKVTGDRVERARGVTS